MPLNVSVPAPVSGNATVMANAVNAAFTAAGYDSFVTAGVDSNGLLTIEPATPGIAETLKLTTLRLSSTLNPNLYGHLASDLTLKVERKRQAQTESDEIELAVLPPNVSGDPPAFTQDNINIPELVDDINLALTVAGVFDVLAFAEPGGDGNLGTSDDVIALASLDPQITSLKIDQVAGNIADIGFVSGATVTTSTNTNPAHTELGFDETQASAGAKFDSFDSFGTVLQDALNSLFGSSLPVNVVYDDVDDVLSFTVGFSKNFSKSVSLNLQDGLDLGIFGTLEVAAGATAGFDAGIDLEVRAGIDLGDLGAGFSFDANTPLSTLNAEDGVLLDTTLIATNPGPTGAFDGRLTSNAQFQLIINGGSGNGGTEVTVTLPSANTQDNFDQLALAEDLSAAIKAALASTGFADGVEAGTTSDGNSLILAGAIPEVVDLKIGSFNSGATQLGFTTGQISNQPDLVITVGSTNYSIVLDGARLVGDVMNAIASLTAGAVTATANADKGLTLTTTSGLPIAVTAASGVDGSPLPTAIALGILGSDTSGVLEGTSLHGLFPSDLLFVEEPAAQDNNLSVYAEVSANDINVSAALGLLGLKLSNEDPNTTSNVPFSLGVLGTQANPAGVRLTDPGTGAADGKIYLREAIASSVDDLIDLDLPTSPFPVSGKVWLSSPLIGELNDGNNDFASFELAGDLTNLQFTTDFNTDALKGLKNLSIEQILDIVGTVVDGIQQNDDIPWMNDPIPLVNKSLNEVVDFLDALLDKVDEITSSVDLDEIKDAKDLLLTAAGDLDYAFELKTELFAAVQHLANVIGEPIDGPVAQALATRASRLVAAIGRLESAVSAIPVSTPGKTELENALAAAQDLVPSLDGLQQRLQDEVATALTTALGVPVSFTFDFVDYDANTTGRQNALVVGLEIDGQNLVNTTFDPKLTLPIFGPVDVEINGNVGLNAGGVFSIGFGAALESSQFTPFLLVNPTDTALTATRLDLNAGVSANNLTADVRFGSLNVLTGALDLRLVRGVADGKDTNDSRQVNGSGQVTLSAAPVGADPRLVIVQVDGETGFRDPDDFSIAGTTLTFINNPPAANTEVTVIYRTVNPGNPVTDVNARAKVSVAFDQAFDSTASTALPNTIGAAPLSELPSLEIDSADGILTANLDATAFGSQFNDIVELAASVDPLHFQLTTDVPSLEDLFANVDFDLVTIVQGIETLLMTLEDGLTNQVVAQLPLVGSSLDTAGTFIGKMKSQYVTPLREFLEEIDGTVETVKNEVAMFVFNVLGPAGIDILGDNNNDTLVDVTDVNVELDKDHFQIDVRLSGGDETFVDFDSGLDGLPIDVTANGGVRVGWDYDIDFGVGIARTGGFYLALNDPLDTTNPYYPNLPAEEFRINVDVGLQVDSTNPPPEPTSLAVDLFGLTLSATDILQDNGKRGTGLGGMLTLDLVSNNTQEPDRLFVGDLSGTPFHENLCGGPPSRRHDSLVAAGRH